MHANALWRKYAACCASLLMALSAAQAGAQTDATACFGEEQWQALQHSTASGSFVASRGALLYVWSPRMVFSAIHAHEVQQEAQALGLRFVPVHDGRLPTEEVAQALAVLPQRLPEGTLLSGPHPLQASIPLCAQSLIERDAYRHYPTAWVVQQGGFHPVPLVSAMPGRFWKMGLLQRLEQKPVNTVPE